MNYVLAMFPQSCAYFTQKVVLHVTLFELTSEYFQIAQVIIQDVKVKRFQFEKFFHFADNEKGARRSQIFINLQT